MKRLLYLILVFFPLALSARNQGQRLADSLLSQLPYVKSDTAKTKLLCLISAAYSTQNQDSAIDFGQQGLEIARKLNWSNGMLLASNTLATIYTSSGNYQKALDCNRQALKIIRESQNAGAIAEKLSEVGIDYLHLSQYPLALEYHTEALQINEKSGNKKGIARNLINIGIVYQNESNYPNAMEYEFRALKMFQDLKDDAGIAGSFNNIGILFIDQQDFPKAMDYFLKALKMNEKIANKSGIGENLTNIGNVYICQGNYLLALNYYEKALKINKELNNKNQISRDLGNIGDVYIHERNYPGALEYLMHALEMNDTLGDKFSIANNLGDIGGMYLTIATDSGNISRSTDLIPATKTAILIKAVDFLSRAVSLDSEIGNLNELQNFSRQLSLAQKLLGKYKEALESYTRYVTTKDSVFSTANNMKIAKLEQKEEAALKEKKIELQRVQIRLYLAFLGMLVIACIGLFSRFRSVHKNKKQLEEKNLLIAGEKEKADMLRLRAERSEQFKQQFLANMSHEIRTPMNAVNGMTDILLDKNPRPDQRTYLEVISRSSDILLHILNDILDLSKIEVGKLEFESIDFSLKETVDHVKDTLSFRAEEKGLHVITRVDDEVNDVLVGDSFRLNQILLNLAGNAIKFTEKGSIAIDVRCVGGDPQMATLQFSVTDTGLGIPADKLNTLFDSFKQVSASDARKYGGSGLGLSICKQLVEMQGGKIWAESELGKGSTFYFNISYPLGSARNLQLRHRREQRADGSQLRGLRILLADDNEYNRLLVVETLLLKAEVKIDQATDGVEAIELLNNNNYDVVLMDVQMPEMNGFEATKYIREKMPPPKNQVPVIALTANMLRFEIEMCLSSGMNTYVPKPFKAWQLINAIAEQTGRNHENQETKFMEQEKSMIESPFQPLGPVTDLAYLTKFCEGDEQRMKKYIKVFIASEPVFSSRISAAIAENDLKKIALQVHGFRPKWMMMGMRKCSELSQRIEKMCSDEGNSTGTISDELSCLMAQNHAAVNELAAKC